MAKANQWKLGKNLKSVQQIIWSGFSDCAAEARKRGWKGDEERYQLTGLDFDFIADNVGDEHGRKPFKEEWADCGLKNVDSQYCE